MLKQFPKLTFLVTGLLLILGGCTSSNKSDGGAAATAPATLAARQLKKSSTEDPNSCLAARSVAEVKGLACSTQGFYTFIDLDGSDLQKLSDLKVTLYSEDGNASSTETHPTVSSDDNGNNIIFGDEDHLSFKGVKLKDDKLDFGFDIIGGNSGGCQAVRSGTPKTCFATVQKTTDFIDTFSIPEINPPESSVTFLYDKVKWHKSYDEGLEEDETVADIYTYGEAVAYCKQLGARLPTNRELAEEMERISGKQAIMETAYPNIGFFGTPTSERDIQDPGLRQEFHEMDEKGYRPSFGANAMGQWTIEFYFKDPGRGLGDAIRKVVPDGSFGNTFTSNAHCEDEGAAYDAPDLVTCEPSDYVLTAICVKDKN